MICSACGARRPADVSPCPHCGAAAPGPTSPPTSPAPAWPPRTEDAAVGSGAPAGPAVGPPGGPPGGPPAGPPGGPPGGPPAGRRRTGLVVGVVAGVVLLLAAAVGGTLVLVGRGESSGAGVATPATRASTTPSGTPTPTSGSTGSPSPEPSFTDLYPEVSSGVLRIETTACDGGGVGSGFLVAPDLVATVAHVVAGSVSIAVRDATTTYSGTVVGYDAATELALVRTDSPVSGHVFTLGTRAPEVGTDIGAIGYPLGGDQSLSKGAVSGLDRTVEVAGRQLAGLIQTDASINPGNSGGPLLTADGTVVGIVEAKRDDAENIGYAVLASGAAPQLAAWESAPDPVRFPEQCAAPVGPDDVAPDVVDRSGHPDGPGIAAAFSVYAGGINVGDYPTAYAILSPADQERIPFDTFAAGLESSYVVDLSIDSVERQGGRDRVGVSFTSLQDPALGRDGQACSDWTLTYEMVRSEDGDWLIDRATPADGSPVAC